MATTIVETTRASVGKARAKKADLAKSRPKAPRPKKYFDAIGAADERKRREKQEQLHAKDNNGNGVTKELKKEKPTAAVFVLDEVLQEQARYTAPKLVEEKHRQEQEDRRFRKVYMHWRQTCLLEYGIVNVDLQHSCLAAGCSIRGGQLVQLPEPHFTWVDVPVRIYAAESEETRRIETVTSTNTRHWQVWRRHVPPVVMYGCTVSGRHHRCRFPEYDCLFTFRPAQRQPGAEDAEICLYSGKHTGAYFAPQERIQEEEYVDQGRRNNYYNQQARPIVQQALAIIPAAKRRKLNSQASMQLPMATQPVPWQRENTDVFFGRTVDVNNMRTRFAFDELSPHWIFSDTNNNDSDETLPVDDYWGRQLCFSDGAVQPPIQQFIAFMAAALDVADNKQPASVLPHRQLESGLRGNLLIQQQQQTATPAHFRPQSLATEEEYATTDRHATQLVARRLTEDFWRSPLLGTSTYEYARSSILGLFEDMTGIKQEQSDRFAPVLDFIRRRILSSPQILKQAEWIGRHALAVALAAGRLATKNAWNKIMGANDHAKYCHERVRDVGLMCAIFECGVEHYLYNQFQAEFQQATGIKLVCQLRTMTTYWIAMQTATLQIFEPLVFY